MCCAGNFDVSLGTFGGEGTYTWACGKVGFVLGPGFDPGPDHDPDHDPGPASEPCPDPDADPCVVGVLWRLCTRAAPRCG